ncbi:hypothetical protein ACQVWH_24615 [Bacillus toyonensis]|uniref:hypothetical protein n=1 Tax=Bacillus toyonensis TaxID=155322 RepID=UPI0003C336B0|nr:hypothetical protein [Bacillus toyonensis]KXY18104.1 hypothetical protein AT259_21215 [Bacillus cereus]AHA10884.1 hypothetical protein Btoyo_5015 [Bacillus toyonensis BCT-7112]HDR3499113.1 hypothetical protein [Bacillus toyonensis]HDR7401968.1 hypothetical protein [Bacillus toyonensis]HDR7700629.1 hypothetical protein [Bacillus toyonensis]
MKLVTIVYENEIGMIEEFNPNNLLGENKYDLDYFDFNNSSLSDFLDYLDFQDCEDYCYICAGSPNRLIKLINYLNKMTSTNIHLYNTNFEKLIGPYNLELNEYEDIDFNALPLPSNDRGTMQLENGISAMISGLYPNNLRNNLIKHLYVENLNLLTNINSTIFSNMALNSCIYIEQPFNEIPDEENYIYPIFESENIKSKIDNNEFVAISKNKLEEDIKYTIDTGEVFNSNFISGYIDYSIVSELAFNNNRLFIFEEGIYQDYLRNIKITSNINSGYQEIVIKLTAINKPENLTNVKTPIYNLYPFCIRMLNLLKSEKGVFITPYTTYKYPPKNNVSDFHVIGIIKDDLSVVYSIKTGQFYKVNEQFIYLLEAYLKDELDSKEIKMELQDNYDYTLKQFMELIKNA